MLYKYVGIDKNGKKIKGHIEALNINSVKSQLKHKQIIYTKIEQEKNFNLFGNFSFKRKRKLSAIQLATISTDLSIYLNSGISLVNSIKLISQRYKSDKKLHPFFVSLETYLQEGKNFYSALEMQDIIEIPPFYLQSIKISEDGGILQGVLIELSIYLKEQDRINKQISSSMAYPMFIIAVSVLMVGFMLSFIVPKITSIFEQNNQALPPITEFVINAGDFVSNYYQTILIGLVVFFGLFSYSLKKFKKFKFNFDKFMLKIPMIGKLIEITELSRFSYMNSILIKSGVPVVQSFKLSSDILKNSVIKEVFSTASSKVVEGEKLSKILENSNIFKVDIAFIQAVAIGEETSQLSSILQNLAQLYTNMSKDKIGVFLTLLEPMLMLVVGGIIGFIVVAMLLPIFSMSLG
ncbi:MAG: type II secretion system F family protein [Campylobacterales bacterium]|nr:type II secretion system F family protein [Campylobacterales bacterium]